MEVNGNHIVVTGGASGLGMATARELVAQGAMVTVADLRQLDADDQAEIGPGILSLACDVTDEESSSEMFAGATERFGQIRGLVHCAGRGGDRLRVLDAAGDPASLGSFTAVVQTNLIGTYNVLCLGASQIARAAPINGERGAIVLTSSVAAFDAQRGQAAYAAAKAGVYGLTLVAARDLASRLIRVNTIAPGIFDTPMMGRFSDSVRSDLVRAVLAPRRLGAPEDFALLAGHLLGNAYINGATVRLDGGIRMPP